MFCTNVCCQNRMGCSCNLLPWTSISSKIYLLISCCPKLVHTCTQTCIHTYAKALYNYLQTFNITCIKSQKLNVSRLIFQLSLLNPFKPGPVFYLLSWSLSHLNFLLQVTWPFSIFTPSDLEDKSLGENKVTSVADLEISWVALTSLFVFHIFLNQYMWHYMVCFTTYLQKTVRILFIKKLGVRYHRLRQHRKHR